MSAIDEKNVDPINEMTRIVENILELNERGFKETYRSTKDGVMIFDSEWCRVYFIWGGWDYAGGNSMQIRYGRLHAPSDGTTMIWQGEECRCWHRVEYALHFLDERAPDETARLGYSHPVTSPFYKEPVRQKYQRRQPEWLAEIQLAIWEVYGQRLFDLFDVRQPILWQQYRQFLKEVYDIEGRDPDIEPALDKVC